ncbi:MAG: dihydroneopterin aldolase [Planctomycetota bacterium]
MIGTISVEGLEIECIIGIHPHERVEPQQIFVDVELDCDIARAAETDDVAHTVDYVDVANLLRELAIDRRYRLIETFVEEAAARILADWPAERVALKVMKPEAIAEATWTAVRIERRR